jgi:hypothetical protein
MHRCGNNQISLKVPMRLGLRSDKDSGFQFGFFGTFGISGNFSPRPLRPLR